jgi:hypothetical protein
MGAQNLLERQAQTSALHSSSTLETNSRLVKETIASIGIGCRLSGTKSTNAFQYLLREAI